MTRLYRNTTTSNPNLPVFTNLYPVASLGPIGVWRGTAAWGDYDNDGWLDLVLSCETASSVPITKFYRNQSGGLVDSGSSLIGLRNSFAVWGDFDRDGNLDLALSGNNIGTTAITRIYQNFSSGTTNTPPSAPAGLSHVVLGKSVQLNWTAAADANQAAGLSYNLRVGTTSGATELVSPLAQPDGVRFNATLGNVNERLTWAITNLTGGIFYWSVQAVDHSYAGSAFAAEQSFTISNLVPVANTLSTTMTEDTTKAITLTGFDPDADPITFNIATPPLFGQLTGSPPNVTYKPATNYFGFDQFTFRSNDHTTDSAPAVVFIEVTPVVDLVSSSLGIQRPSGGSVQLTLTGEVWRSYAIEVSDDLIHWVRLTTFICTNSTTQWFDPDAANRSQRFYRSALFVAMPEISPTAQTGSNQFRFVYTGGIGRNLQIQASTNLLNWTALANVIPTNTSMPFTDVDAVRFSRRFYRIISY